MRVIDAAEAVGRATIACFSGVIEHDVKNHLDLRGVERPDELAELVPRGRPRRLARVRLLGARRRSCCSPRSSSGARQSAG